jgi:hypothetical protein
MRNSQYSSAEPVKTDNPGVHRLGVWVSNQGFFGQARETRYNYSVYYPSIWGSSRGGSAEASQLEAAVKQDTVWLISEIQSAIDELERHKARLETELERGINIPELLQQKAS